MEQPPIDVYAKRRIKAEAEIERLRAELAAERERGRYAGTVGHCAPCGT